MSPTSSAPRWRPSHREVSGGGRRLPHRVRAEDDGARVVPRRGGVAGVAASSLPWRGPRCVWHRALAHWSVVGGASCATGTVVPCLPTRTRTLRQGVLWRPPAASTVHVLSLAHRHGGARDGGRMVGASPPTCQAVAPWSLAAGGRTGVSCPRPWGPTASAGGRRRLRAGRFTHESASTAE